MILLLRLWPGSTREAFITPWLTHLPCDSLDSAIMVGRVIEQMAEMPYECELLAEKDGTWEVVAQKKETA